MFNVLLAVAYIVTISTASSTPPECEPSNFLCSGICPHFPEDLELTSESVCLRDIESDACVCWMNNPASYLQSLFRCETKVNGTVSQYMCNPPSDCFSPDPDRPVCMIVLQCSCLLDTRFPHKVFDHWKRVKALVHTKVKSKKRDYNRQPVEKVHGEVREFNLKHLLFLIGFVVAPLLCWCVLNFFQDGRCRKKTTDPPEAQPMPTSRSSTIDNMNNCDDLCGDRNCEDVVVVVTPSHNPRSSSVRSLSVPALHPSAPGDLDIIETAQQQTLIKCESPPPYCESMERSFNRDFGPPPAYEEAVRGTDINIQQLWQTVFILPSESTNNS